jgi:hypothetical protein
VGRSCARSEQDCFLSANRVSLLTHKGSPLRPRRWRSQKGGVADAKKPAPKLCWTLWEGKEAKLRVAQAPKERPSGRA